MLGMKNALNRHDLSDGVWEKVESVTYRTILLSRVSDSHIGRQIGWLSLSFRKSTVNVECARQRSRQWSQAKHLPRHLLLSSAQAKAISSHVSLAVVIIELLFVRKARNFVKSSKNACFSFSGAMAGVCFSYPCAILSFDSFVQHSLVTAPLGISA